jgi:hypothetical protein
MPYIEQRRADWLMQDTTKSLRLVPEDSLLPGDLTWLISELVAWYVREEGLSYDAISDVLGSLESTKQEFYHRVARPYEAGKVFEATKGERVDPFADLLPGATETEESWRERVGGPSEPEVVS